MTTISGLWSPRSREALTPWALVVAGLLALYLPSFIDLFRGAWASETNAHGPIVMVVAFAFLYRRVRQMAGQGMLNGRPQPLAGSLIFVSGLLCYVLGRSQSVLILEMGSLILVLSGIIVRVFGLSTWSRMWFAFFFMLFMIPLPASIVDAVTLPMKIAASYSVEHLLYWIGYPIARSGVILFIGPYQLLVADACAGLNSLFTLEALGLLYMNLVRHPSMLRNAALATLIMPISFAANTIRIALLALITYHLGDAAGQGFLHSFSSLMLFVSALLLIIGVDRLLTWIVRKPQDAAPAASTSPTTTFTWQHMGAVSRRTSVGLLTGMVLAPALAQALTPVMSDSATPAQLDDSVPRQFGQWALMPARIPQAGISITGEQRRDQDQLYDDVLLRTYVNKTGDQVMLAIAYAREQRQDVKLHLPEICYPAQGYKVLQLMPVPLAIDGTTLPGKHMLASGNGRLEAVTYWTRISDGYPQDGLGMRLKIFQDGLHGRISDGVLVRASTVLHNNDETHTAFALQQRFLRELVAAVNLNNGSNVELVARR